MIISDTQIMQLIGIAHAYIATAFRLGGSEREVSDLQDFLQTITDQQSSELKLVGNECPEVRNANMIGACPRCKTYHE